jgi:hypothetical protein
MFRDDAADIVSASYTASIPAQMLQKCIGIHLAANLSATAAAQQ